MSKVWVVRAGGGRAETFREGGYASVGFNLTADMTKLTERQAIESAVSEIYSNKRKIANVTGQVHAFMNEMQVGDYIVTPATEGKLYTGTVETGEHQGRFFVENPDFTDNHHNRRRVKYVDDFLFREELSVPFRYSLMGQLTVYSIDNYRQEFLTAIREDLSGSSAVPKSLKRRLLELDGGRTECLVAALLAAMGCENVRQTGQTGDRGVDVRATLVSDRLITHELYVQVKRYASTGIIPRNTVQQLRSAIPLGGQGVFVTTSDFSEDARLTAREAGFPSITLINGDDLVDLVVQHWRSLPIELRQAVGPLSARDRM